MFQIAHEMAQSCEKAIRKDIKGVPIKINVVKETNCIGNGTGIMYDFHVELL